MPTTTTGVVVAKTSAYEVTVTQNVDGPLVLLSADMLDVDEAERLVEDLRRAAELGRQIRQAGTATV